MNEAIALEKQLDRLKFAHSSLDDRIDQMASRAPYDDEYNEFELQRMKRERLKLKDQISDIEEQLYPDMSA